jgi:UDP-N-acetylmuramate--alanine ligase
MMVMADPVAPVRGVPGELPTRDELPPVGSEIHLVGIGGAGMRGLAVLLAEAGYRVSGCDGAGVEGLDELTARGVHLCAGHDPSHTVDSDLVVYSSAIPHESPELAAAREASVPLLKRARALGALVRGARVIGVAGTHGKTTITALTGLACETSDLDPTVLVGGHMPWWNGFARPGSPDLIVVEADEYDRSFLELDPALAVVSSLEPEHLDTYGTVDALREAYEAFASRAISRDGLVYCWDDAGARALGESFESPLSYGFAPEARYRLEIEASTVETTACRVSWPEGRARFNLRIPGRHNALNAAAGFAAALRMGGDPELIAAGLERFKGVARRLETLLVSGRVTVVDDYAHHPTEVAASIDALRTQHADARLVVVFQPHLFTRTEVFAAEFARALAGADEVLVLPIYPSREHPIEGVTSARIVVYEPDRLREASKEEAVERAVAVAPEEPTVIVYMGAGDVTRLAHEAAGELSGDAVGP